jgi:hypothetical protein
MKKITFRADERLVKEARLVAESQHTTLTAAFRKWLSEFAEKGRNSLGFDKTMTQFRHIRSGRRFTRDEMNQR